MRTNQFIYLLVVISISFTCNLPSSEAHLVGGFNKDVDGYRFQFITDPLFAQVDEEVFLAFSIQNSSNGFGIRNAQASVIVSRDGEVIRLFENIDALSGDFAVPYRFEDTGQYIVMVQLISADTVTSAEFPVDVSDSGLNLVFLLIGVCLAMVFIVILIIRWRSL